MELGQMGNNNSVLPAERETDSSEIMNLLMDRHHSFHAYASLLAKITSLIDHIPRPVFKHVLHEGDRCANFSAKLWIKSTFGIPMSPPNRLISLLPYSCSRHRSI